MFNNKQMRIGAGLFLLILGVAADTSLWIPDADPQAEALSAGILGVGSDGKTTWIIQQGSTSGQDTPYSGTVTFIDGPSDAVIEMQFTGENDAGVATSFIFTESCVKSGTLAVCVGGGGGEGGEETFTETDTIAPFSVQGGGFLAGASSGGAPALTAESGSPTQTSSGGQASAGSSVSGGASPTNTATKDSGARRDGVCDITALVGLATIGGIFYLV